MKELCGKVLLGCLSIAWLLPGFQDSKGNQDPVVRATVSREYYCLGQPGGIGVAERQLPGSVTLRLRIRLSYRNVGSKPLILPLLNRVSAIIVDPLDKNPALIVPYGTLSPPEDVTQGGLSEPNSLFEVIPPGETDRKYYSRVDQNVFLVVHDVASTNRKTELLGKKVSLRLELDHLRFPETVAKDLAARWVKYGYLWTGKVKTDPIELDIPASPKIADCSHEYRID